MKLKNLSFEGSIYLANTLFEENGAIDYNGIHKIEEFEEYEGFKFDKNDINQYQLNQIEELEQFLKNHEYYTWFNGWIILMSKDGVKKMIDTYLTDEYINLSLENISNSNQYIKEIVEIAYMDF